MDEIERASDAIDTTFRGYALKYFEIHAEQRLIAFRFFVTFAIAIGGALTYFLRTEESSWLSAGLGFLLSFLAVVFWMLDVRTRNLVKNGENALKYLDERCGLSKPDLEPHVLALFTRDDYIRDENRSWRKFSCGKISYTLCFKIVFVVVFAIGLIVGMTCAYTVKPWRFFLEPEGKTALEANEPYFRMPYSLPQMSTG